MVHKSQSGEMEISEAKRWCWLTLFRFFKSLNAHSVGKLLQKVLFYNFASEASKVYIQIEYILAPKINRII